MKKRDPRERPGPLARLWAGGRGPVPTMLAVATAPAAVLYGAAVRVRNLLYDLAVLRSRSAPIPVISVGNLAVGGTGKTPVSAWIVRELEARGYRPALVTRGYGEDEVLLHRQWNTGVPVIRAPKRIEGLERAAGGGSDVAVLDDGFQHRSVRRTRDIVLLSPAHPFPPRLLPRGPFREPLGSLRRADHILVTAKGEGERDPALEMARALRRIPGLAPVDVLSLEFGAWTDLAGTPAVPPPGSPLAVCSIAQPEGFVRAVRSRTAEDVRLRSFPDHHDYSPDDVQALARSAADSTAWIATTEKDAVKLIRFRELLPVVRVLPLVVSPEAGLGEALLSDLREPEADRRRQGDAP